MDDELEHHDDTSDTAGITPGPALRATLEVAATAGEVEADDEAPPLVRARWVGQPVWNPEQGVIGYGDPIEVTPEQLHDDATQAVPWDDDWAADPDLAALSAAALGEGSDDPEEG